MEINNDFSLHFELKELHDTVLAFLKRKNISHSEKQEMALIADKIGSLISELRKIDHSLSSGRRKSLAYLVECYKDLKTRIEGHSGYVYDQSKMVE